MKKLEGKSEEYNMLYKVAVMRVMKTHMKEWSEETEGEKIYNNYNFMWDILHPEDITDPTAKAIIDSFHQYVTKLVDELYEEYQFNSSDDVFSDIAKNPYEGRA